MKIELSVLSVYSVLSVSFYLDLCYIGMEIEHTSSSELHQHTFVLILVILEWR